MHCSTIRTTQLLGDGGNQQVGVEVVPACTVEDNAVLEKNRCISGERGDALAMAPSNADKIVSPIVKSGAACRPPGWGGGGGGGLTAAPSARRSCLGDGSYQQVGVEVVPAHMQIQGGGGTVIRA